MARVLIIDDDPLVRRSIERCVADMGHEALTAGSLKEGLALAETGVDTVYLDLSLPDGAGQNAVEALTACPLHPEIIVITGMGGNYGAEDSLTRGAWEYISKPASPSIIRESLASVLEYRHSKLPHEDAAKKENDGALLKDCGIIGHSAAMDRVRRLIGRAAESEASVLILGETGAGKELVAHAIHANSGRSNGPFVVVDCSNITESLAESTLYGHVKGAFTGAHADRQGLVAAANGGTLFLDEVGELPASMQKYFLRVLQEHTFRPVGSEQERSSNFRLVAATNRDLESMTHEGQFRSDLLFRLRTVEVHLPPLRDRGGDIAELADFFVQKTCKRYDLPGKRLSRQLIKKLEAYPWPGNIRELANIIESSVIDAGRDPIIYPKHLPSQMRVSFLEKEPQPTHAAPSAPQASSVPIMYGEDQPRHPALADQTPMAEAPAEVQTYERYKSQRDKIYFQQLMDLCQYDVTKASHVSGLSVPSIYRHLALVGISTKRRPQ